MVYTCHFLCQWTLCWTPNSLLSELYVISDPHCTVQQHHKYVFLKLLIISLSLLMRVIYIAHDANNHWPLSCIPSALWSIFPLSSSLKLLLLFNWNMPLISSLPAFPSLAYCHPMAVNCPKVSSFMASLVWPLSSSGLSSFFNQWYM